MRKLCERIFQSKEMREYNKMYKRHRKTMIELAKEDRDWDYGYMHDLVVAKIKHMYEYYSAGNNVWQSEETYNKVVKTLKHAMDLADKIDQTFDVEPKLYAEFYTYIGKNICWWWD